MLIGALVGLIVGLVEALVRRDLTCIGSRIKDGVAIGGNWLGKAGGLAGGLFGVIVGGVFGFKIAIYAGGAVGLLKGLNNGVQRAEIGFKEGFIAGFTGKSQPPPPTLTQQPAEKVLSTLEPLTQSTARVPLNMGPYLNILENLGIFPLVIKQIELRLENPLLKRLMTYVLTDYISPLLKPPLDQAAAMRPSRDDHDNKENMSPEDLSIDPTIPASSILKLWSLLKLPGGSSAVVQQNNDLGGKRLFEPVTPKIVAKPSPLLHEEKDSLIDNPKRN